MVLTNGNGRKIISWVAVSLYERKEKLLIQTERLLLRRWREEDREPFYRMNSDPRVMEFMPACLTRAESDMLFERVNEHFRKHDFGLCAAELREGRTFIGYVGLAVPTFEASFTPCVEIGWRLSADNWGRGLATEGARAMAGHAFEELGLEEIVSFTVPENMRSRRVMERIGMTHDASDDFDHPNLPEGHPLRRHVLYRLRKRETRPE
jgi:RimJ/RimL family protein N-acetyltransferase